MKCNHHAAEKCDCYKSKNFDLLSSFMDYCQLHPNQRFWQALRNWSGWAFISASSEVPEYAGGYNDTFYWTKNETP